MSEIPTELIREILLRVPAVALLRFRRVCTVWRLIIDDPDFIKSHLRLQSGGNHLITSNHWDTEFHTISLESLSYFNGGIKTIEAAPLQALDGLGLPCPRILPGSSCHGLILLHHYDVEKVWGVWNPFTREYRELPAYVDLTLAKHGVYYSGLGYDDISDDYKVVRLSPYPDYINECVMMETIVYCLKLNCWRRIKDFPSCFLPTSGDGAFLNGALHWISVETGSIVAFDLGVENYRLLPFPSAHLSKFYVHDLDVLGGCLFLSLLDERARMVRIMNDYGVESSWTKLFSTTQLVERGQTGGLMRPIAYLKSKNQVLIHHDGKEFLWYNVEKKCMKKVIIIGASNFSTFLVSPASLFRLNNSGAVRTIATDRSQGDKILKLTLITADVINPSTD